VLNAECLTGVRKRLILLAFVSYEAVRLWWWGDNCGVVVFEKNPLNLSISPTGTKELSASRARQLNFPRLADGPTARSSMLVLMWVRPWSQPPSAAPAVAPMVSSAAKRKAVLTIAFNGDAYCSTSLKTLPRVFETELIPLAST